MATPDRIGRYRVDSRLGSGGFAVVWAAHDEQLDTTVAIKVMAEHWSDRMDLRERFLTEARMLRRASSSRVVQVFDIGELPDGRPYFVMDHADRGTLTDQVAAQAPDLPEALRLTAEVARAVSELHHAGIVHRDVKPSNVLIKSAPDGSERFLIADLGVAKNLSQSSGVTMSVGSMGYMSPEQIEPSTGIDVRADVYSIGAVGYRLVSGQVPGLPGGVTPIGELVPGLPGDVAAAITRAMAVDRQNRWPDAAVLARELDRLARRLSTDSPTVTSTQAPAMPPLRRPTAGVDPAALARGPAARPPQNPAQTAETHVFAAPSYGSPAPHPHPPEPGAPLHFPGQQLAAPPAGRSRRRGAVLAAVVLLVVVAGAGAAFTLRQSKQPVTVEAGAITVEVPRDWSDEHAGPTWDPATLGLASGSEDGVVVADDVRRWGDLDRPVNGVFVGFVPQGDAERLSGTVGRITHAGCEAGDTVPYTGTAWTGRTRAFTGCDGSDRSITEAWLTAEDGDQAAYVQIREARGADRTQRILDGIHAPE